MNILQELIKDIHRNGTLEEKYFSRKLNLESKDRSRTIELLKEVMCNLYEEGYTPAEIKGFFQIAIRLSLFHFPKQ